MSMRREQLTMTPSDATVQVCLCPPHSGRALPPCPAHRPPQPQQRRCSTSAYYLRRPPQPLARRFNALKSNWEWARASSVSECARNCCTTTRRHRQTTRANRPCANAVANALRATGNVCADNDIATAVCMAAAKGHHVKQQSKRGTPHATVPCTRRHCVPW